MYSAYSFDHHVLCYVIYYWYVSVKVSAIILVIVESLSFERNKTPYHYLFNTPHSPCSTNGDYQASKTHSFSGSVNPPLQGQ